MSGSPFAPPFNYQFGPNSKISGSTARDIIQDALEMLRVYAPGEEFSPPDGARGLSVLNDMVDSWSNESLACFAWLTQTFTLIPNKYQYTVGGAGADIAGPRPLRVSDAPGAAYLLDQNQNRYLMDVLDQLKWNTVTTAVANSDLPNVLFYDPQLPLGIINIWPTPTVGYTCSFLSYEQLTDFSTYDTTVGFPPGYKLAFTANLAVALKPYFKDAQLDPIVEMRARESKGTIKRNNMRTQISVFDSELVSRGNAVYNIYTDRGAGRL
jgi:hypothetical protein